MVACASEFLFLVTLMSTRVLKTPFLSFCESAFWKGCGGTLFREKGSPAFLIKITSFVPQAHGGGASFPSYGVRY